MSCNKVQYGFLYNNNIIINIYSNILNNNYFFKTDYTIFKIKIKLDIYNVSKFSNNKAIHVKEQCKII